MLMLWNSVYYVLILLAVCVLPVCVFLYENEASLLYPHLLNPLAHPNFTFSQKLSKPVTVLILVVGSIGITAILALLYYFLEKSGFSADGDYTISIRYAIPSLATLCSWVLFIFFVPYGMVYLPIHLFTLILIRFFT